MGGKKKWAKGRVREKINNLVVLDQKKVRRALILWICPVAVVVTLASVVRQFRVSRALAQLVNSLHNLRVAET